MSRPGQHGVLPALGTVTGWLEPLVWLLWALGLAAMLVVLGRQWALQGFAGFLLAEWVIRPLVAARAIRVAVPRQRGRPPIRRRWRSSC